MNETKAVNEIRAGKADGYRELVDRYQTGLIIHCENIVKDRALAEDVAQEAFVKAYYQLKNFDEAKARFSTWLYKIATNTAYDALRRQKKTMSIEDINEIAEATMPLSLQEDEKQHIRDTVGSLEPPKYAAIIRGYYWEGKSYSQLAEEHHTTVGSIGSWMSRAKLQLKEKLS